MTVARSHPDVEILQFSISIEGGEPEIVPVLGAEKIEFKIPENSKYVISIHFKAKKTLKNFRYVQVVKRHGITVKNRELEVGDYEASDEIYVKQFPEDNTPGGFIVRGVYPATSTYYANDEELMTTEWSLEITKKK